MQPERRSRRWKTSDLTDRVLELLEELPEEFSRDDVLSRLGDNPPERSMLYRVLQELVRGNVLAVTDRGGGRNPVRYRRIEGDDDAEPGGDGAAGE